MSTYRRKNANRQFRRQLARRNQTLAGRTTDQLSQQRNAIARVAAATREA